MLINYLLLLTTLLLFGGLALDTGLLQARRLGAQQAADAAALEAMYVYARGDNTYATAGQAQAALNGFTNGVNGTTVSIVNPPTGGTFSGNTLAVQATVTQSVKTLFMGKIGQGTSTIAASAVAKIDPTCIWIMNDSGNSATGSLRVASATLAPNCGVYIGTSDNNSQYNLQVDYFANLNAEAFSTGHRIRIVGSSARNASTGSVSAQPKFGAAVKRDPLAYVTAPAQPTSSSCTYSTLVSHTSGTHTLSPGTYCAGISFSNSTVTLSPGLYIIAGGLTVFDSSFTGTGVTLYFTKLNTSSSYSSVVINSDNASNASYGLFLKAPTTSANGAIPGVVMFGDRSWVDHGNQDVQMTSCHITTDGYWYFLNTGLYMWSTQFGYYKYNGLVVDNYYQYLSTNLFNSDFSDLAGVSPLHYEDGVLVQ